MNKFIIILCLKDIYFYEVGVYFNQVWYWGIKLKKYMYIFIQFIKIEIII